MKKSITILISIIAFSVCKGQATTTTNRTLKEFEDSCKGCLNGTTVSVQDTGLYIWQFNKKIVDTIKVQMLVSDKFSNKVVIIKGYVIQNNGWNRIPFEYLDIIKQPLAGTITVWDYKPLK